MARPEVVACEDKMKKALEKFGQELGAVRTGRASPSVLDGIRVVYYGKPMPVNQVAAVSVPDARTLEIRPWDKSVLPELEKAIQKSDLGISPQSDGNVIRLPMPALTEERRQTLVKQVRQTAESHRVMVRNARRDALEQVKALKSSKKISEDDERTVHNELQKLTDGYVRKLDEALAAKEKQILTL